MKLFKFFFLFTLIGIIGNAYAATLLCKKESINVTLSSMASGYLEVNEEKVTFNNYVVDSFIDPRPSHNYKWIVTVNYNTGYNESVGGVVYYLTRKYITNTKINSNNSFEITLDIFSQFLGKWFVIAEDVPCKISSE